MADETGVNPGLELARLRRAAGVSQALLAARLNTTQSAVARLETGGLSPSVNTLARAYAALGHRLALVARPAGAASAPAAAGDTLLRAATAARRPAAVAALRGAGVVFKLAPRVPGAPPRVIYARTAENARRLAAVLATVGTRLRVDPQAMFTPDAWALWAGDSLELTTDAGDLDLVGRATAES